MLAKQVIRPQQSRQLAALFICEAKLKTFPSSKLWQNQFLSIKWIPMDYKNLILLIQTTCLLCWITVPVKGKHYKTHRQWISRAAADIGKHYITHEITPRRLSTEECFLERMLSKKEAIWMLDDSKSNLIHGALNQTLCSPHSLQLTHYAHTISWA